MMRLRNKILISLSIVVTGIILCLSFLINLDQYKPIIISTIKNKTNLSVKIDGPIKLRLFPNPHVHVIDVKIDAQPGLKNPYLFEAKSIAITPSLNALFNRQFKINEVTINHGHLYLEKKLSNNKTPQDGHHIVRPQPSPVNKVENEALFHKNNNFVQKIRFNDCQVTYSDQDDDKVIEGINLVVKGNKPNSLLQVEGTFKYNNTTVKAVGKLNNIVDNISFNGTLSWLNQELTIDGLLNPDTLNSHGKLKLKGSFKDFLTQGSSGIQDASQNYKIVLAFTLDDKTLQFPSIKLVCNKMVGEGNGSYSLSNNKAIIRLLLNPGAIQISAASVLDGAGSIIAVNVNSAFGNLLQFLKSCGVEYSSIPESVGINKQLRFRLNLPLKKVFIDNIIFASQDSQLINGLIEFEPTQDKDKPSKLVYELTSSNVNHLIKLFKDIDVDASQKFVIDGETLISDGHYKVASNIELGKSVLTVQGNIDHTKELLETNLNIHARGNNLGQFLKLIDDQVNLPVLKHYHFSCNISSLGQKIKLSKFVGVITTPADKINLQGTGEYANNLNKAQIKIDLSCDQLNIDKIVKDASSTSNQNQSNNVSDNRSPSLNPKEYQPQHSGHWSHEPISFKFLQEIEGTINLKCDHLTYHNVSIKNLIIPMTMINGILDISTINGTIGDGSLTAKMRISSQHNQPIHFKGSLDNTRVSDLRAITPSKIYLKDGLINATIDVNSTGVNEYDYIQNLQGSMTIKAQKGKISGFDLQKISDSLNAAKNLSGLSNLFSAAFNGGETQFDEFMASIKFDHGIGRFEELLLDATNLTAKGSGKINFPQYHYNINGLIQLSSIDKLPPFSVVISGPLDNPHYDIDKSEFMQYFIKNIFKGVTQDIGKIVKSPGKSIKNFLGSILGQADPDEASNKQKTNQPQSKKERATQSKSNQNQSSSDDSPKRQLKSVLKNLF